MWLRSFAGGWLTRVRRPRRPRDAQLVWDQVNVLSTSCGYPATAAVRNRWQRGSVVLEDGTLLQGPQSWGCCCKKSLTTWVCCTGEWHLAPRPAKLGVLLWEIVDNVGLLYWRMAPCSKACEAGGAAGWIMSVSYTHLTLPTRRTV